jgi:hypothetical protein
MEDIDPLSNAGRRVFIKGLGFVSVALLLGTLGGCDKLADAIKNRPIRRRLRTGSAEVDADIDTYRQAVAAMKALPASDPRSWGAQAEIHGTVAGGFKFCEHGTDHFFDWHRAYLFYFEKICQKLTGNPKFGLPYWNWNQNLDIHPAFLDAASPLACPGLTQSPHLHWIQSSRILTFSPSGSNWKVPPTTMCILSLGRLWVVVVRPWILFFGCITA